MLQYQTVTLLGQSTELGLKYSPIRLLRVMESHNMQILGTFMDPAILVPQTLLALHLFPATGMGC
jgi:hypothetical protein